MTTGTPPAAGSATAGLRATWTNWVDEAVRPRLRIARLLPSGGEALVVSLVVLNVLLGLLPVAFVLATSVLVGEVPAAVGGGVGSAPWDRLTSIFLVAAAAFLLTQILTPVGNALGQQLRRRVDSALRDDAMALMLRPVGIGPLEDQRTLDELNEAVRAFERDWGTPGQACFGLVALVARYTRLVALVTAIGLAIGWPAALGVGAAVLAFRYGQRGGLRKYSRVGRDLIGRMREIGYLHELTMTDVAAKEIRVFGLTGWLADRYAAVWEAVRNTFERARRRVYLTPYLLLTALGLLLAGGAMVYAAQLAATGRVGLTALALGVQAVVLAISLGGYYPEADTSTQYAMQSLTALQRLRDRLDELDEGQPPAGRAAVPPGTPAASLTFDRVGFHYPGSDRTVLDGIELDLPAGRCTAVVGVNGAGKTTLVKLLARLYEPTSGAVRADGVDIAEFDPVLWRRQVGVIFQDFVRYELTAAENIALGAAHVPVDRAVVLRAAERAGIAEALSALPGGLDTPLSRAYPGGTDLSGGQWQRIAIARALYALEAGARVLVLDEPTAALDVRAEVAFFDRFVELTRGVTSLLISHRFSSVRRADHIVVVDGGQVVERGSHDELMVAGGHYARLFALQAKRFAHGLDADDAEDGDVVDGDAPIGDTAAGHPVVDGAAADGAAADKAVGGVSR
ncbi:ABC transporter ATP-binding protein [Saccharothrix texasensis]|uniref:ATP-binding cassette subfamily B protein n=1 Tax=Saccharothrix texasensis TaxID=103734 RepID=A0A3N1GXW8_9PSEU|nr:ABC transporter ATP-binding protein [Saccharothrix texasensis]ROP35009.1 ATP-binding cassette subfamily B protein [Saccharothrix texasensis]